MDLFTNLTQRKGFWWALAGGVLAGSLLILTYDIFYAANDFGESPAKTLFVPRGASFKSVLDSLDKTGVIESRWRFSFAGRVLGWTKDVKVGKYVFENGISNLEILRSLRDGDRREFIFVSVPEGRRYQSIARRFARELGIDSAKIASYCTDTTFIRRLGIHAPTLEGYLLPDTYKFMWQTDEEKVVERMISEFNSFFADSLRTRMHQLKMPLNEVLTFASIVEGEAILDSERARIAGVYYNRLRKRMRLEADPTVQYVLPDGPRRLLYRDLKLESPYNTYRNYGLPPGPINNPGRQSILAVLYPEQHQYLYFVVDGTGGHKFTKTYSEHQRAVQQYRRMMREQRANSRAGS